MPQTLDSFIDIFQSDGGYFEYACRSDDSEIHKVLHFCLPASPILQTERNEKILDSLSTHTDPLLIDKLREILRPFSSDPFQIGYDALDGRYKLYISCIDWTNDREQSSIELLSTHFHWSLRTHEYDRLDCIGFDIAPLTGLSLKLYTITDAPPTDPLFRYTGRMQTVSREKVFHRLHSPLSIARLNKEAPKLSAQISRLIPKKALIKYLCEEGGQSEIYYTLPKVKQSTIEIYMTQVCNLNCEYCYVDLEAKLKQFDQTAFHRRIHLLDYQQIRFIGGEPLIQWESIQQIILSTRAQDETMWYMIVTNGTLLTEEIVDFCLTYGVEIDHSLHLSALSRFFGAHHIQKLLPLGRLLRWSLIFEPHHLQGPLHLIEWLHRCGFRGFSLAPEIYADWSDESRKHLTEVLARLTQLALMDRSLVFYGPPGNELPLRSRDCHKTVTDQDGQTHLCNRLGRIPEGFQYEDAFGYFDQVNDCINCHQKWFCICPVSWYLDARRDEKLLHHRARTFHFLNEIFIDFYRSIARGRGVVNFLTGPYTELRLNMTNQCNLRCAYCYLDFDHRTISVEIAQNIIEWHLRDGTGEKIISFFGGEPLLEQAKITTLVEYSKTLARRLDRTVSYRIATNATLLSESYIRFLVEHHFDIHISWNGLPEIHDSTRDGSWSRLSHGLTLLDPYIPRNTLGILLGFGPDQVASLFDSFEYIFARGYRRFQFEMFYGEKYSWSPHHLQILDLQIARISRRYGSEYICLNQKNVSSLDISVDGEASSESFAFHTPTQVDLRPRLALLESLRRWGSIR